MFDARANGRDARFKSSFDLMRERERITDDSDSGKYQEQVLSINKLLLLSYRYDISVCWKKILM